MTRLIPPAGALQEALDQHALVLLVFCVRRTLEVDALPTLQAWLQAEPAATGRAARA